MASSLKNLGADVEFISRIGNDSLGKELLMKVKNHGVSISHIQKDAIYSTGEVQVNLNSSGVAQYEISKDAAWDFIEVLPETIEMVRSASAFIFGKLLTPKTSSPILLIVINLALIEYCRANMFTGFPWLMPSISLASNQYILQTLSYVGSFSGNLVVLTLSILPIILFLHMPNKKLIFSLLFIPILYAHKAPPCAVHNTQ